MGVDAAVFGPLKCIGLVKIGGKIGEGINGFWPSTNSIDRKRLCKVS